MIIWSNALHVYIHVFTLVINFYSYIYNYIVDSARKHNIEFNHKTCPNLTRIPP